MNPQNALLISKYASSKCLLAITMLVQAKAAADVSSTAFMNTDLKANPPQAVMELLAHARFFSETCGWFALSVRRLRHEKVEGMTELLAKRKKMIDTLYDLRIAVNHHYNEDLAEEYRKDKFTPGRHQDKLAFVFIPNPEEMSFKIGTIDVSIVAHLAMMDIIIKELSEL